MGTESIAFGILSHCHPPQVERLVDRLLEAGPGTRVVVHHDASSGEPLRPGWSPTGVHVLPRPRHITWGDGLDVLAMLDVLRAIDTMEVSHLIFLSGQDYPLRPLPELVTHLRESPADLHMDSKPVGPTTGWPPGEATARYGYRHTRMGAAPAPVRGALRSAAKALVRSHPRPDPDGAEFLEDGVTAPLLCRMAVGDEVFVGVRRKRSEARRYPLHVGGQWFALSHETCRRVVEHHDAHADLWQAMARTVLPDEAYFQTVAADLPGLTFAPWLHYLEHDGPRARTLTAADVPRYQATGAYFCRKVDERVDPAVLDLLDLRR